MKSFTAHAHMVEGRPWTHHDDLVIRLTNKEKKRKRKKLFL